MHREEKVSSYAPATATGHWGRLCLREVGRKIMKMGMRMMSGRMAAEDDEENTESQKMMCFWGISRRYTCGEVYIEEWCKKEIC